MENILTNIICKRKLHYLERFFMALIRIAFVINWLHELTEPQKNLFSEIITLVKLFLLAADMNAIRERSYSTLRRTKTLLYNDTKLNEALHDVKHIQ